MSAGRLASRAIDRALSINTLPERSAEPFCSAVYGGDITSSIQVPGGFVQRLHPGEPHQYATFEPDNPSDVESVR